MKQHLNQFLRFCLVGALGFAVDAGMLELLIYGELSAPIARLFSITVALQVTYFLHSAFTFRHRGGFTPRTWLRFIAANLIGAAVNYIVFLGLLVALPDTQSARLFALASGTAVALLFNYIANRRFVFSPSAGAR